MRKAPSYLAEGGQYYSYDGHYFYASNKYEVMLNDYKNSTRANSINSQNPYYNYYQFLPMRSTSVYSASDIDGILARTGNLSGDSKMNGIGGALTSNQNTYGVNALLIAGIAGNESAWGKSDYARQRNNLFGLAAIDSNPDNAYSFSSVSNCIKDFAETYMSTWWLNPSNWRYFGGFVGDKGSGINVKYASDPYWGEKAAANAWLLDGIGGSKDQYMYTVAIKDTLSSSHQNLAVRTGSNASAAVIYTTGTQSNTSFLLPEGTAQNGFYKIMSDGVLNNSRTSVDGSTGNYNFSTMYGYIASNSVIIVNKGTNLGSVDKFRDVGQGDWFYDSAKFVYERNIMTGMDTFSFAPAANLDRGQFTTILYRMQNSPSTAYKSVFPDVPDGYFFTLPVLWAYNNKVVSGYVNGRFGPSDKITREQMAVMMYRYAKFCGLNTSDNGNISSFPDAARVSDFSKVEMNWAVGAGLIQGDQGKLNPQGDASRAQCATIITRFMKKYGL
ncbi:MAG: S-layer homology domain-containing protein [Muricomes sp.]